MAVFEQSKGLLTFSRLNDSDKKLLKEIGESQPAEQINKLEKYLEKREIKDPVFPQNFANFVAKLSQNAKQAYFQLLFNPYVDLNLLLSDYLLTNEENSKKINAAPNFLTARKLLWDYAQHRPFTESIKGMLRALYEGKSREQLLLEQATRSSLRS
ncbi:MAG: hypothetical protein ACP5T4_02530 [Candidatus Micrarchaeia archaeon]